MRHLSSFEEPVLPVGVQNLVTGENKYYNVNLNESGNVSLIKLKRYSSQTYVYAINLSGRAKEKGTFAHDQTHRPIGDYILVQEYSGTFKEMFNQIKIKIGKRGVFAFVYK